MSTSWQRMQGIADLTARLNVNLKSFHSCKDWAEAAYGARLGTARDAGALARHPPWISDGKEFVNVDWDDYEAEEDPVEVQKMSRCELRELIANDAQILVSLSELRDLEGEYDKDESSDEGFQPPPSDDDDDDDDHSGASEGDEAAVEVANDETWQHVPHAHVGTDWRNHDNSTPELRGVESVDDWITMFMITCPPV